MNMTMTMARSAINVSITRMIPSRMHLQSESQCRCTRGTTTRWYASSKGTNNNTEEEPFYGKPRATTTTTTMIGRLQYTNRMDRIAIAVHNATTAFADPTRADAVAALGEITGPITLRRIHDTMMKDPTGRLILQERPIVTKANIPYEKLIAEAPDINLLDDGSNDDDFTFGQAYGSFLKVHGFDPDERDEVKFVEDETLAYIMLRYRQVRTGVVYSIFYSVWCIVYSV